LVKKDVKIIKPINYTIDNQKITFDFLKSHLWSAADILRGSLDPGDYRQPVMTLLFLKRLNDTFEENAEKLIEQGKAREKPMKTKGGIHSLSLRMLDGQSYPRLLKT
jgi:type I restriction-modification system DNA methylase subunit